MARAHRFWSVKCCNFFSQEGNEDDFGQSAQYPYSIDSNRKIFQIFPSKCSLETVLVNVLTLLKNREGRKMQLLV